MHQALDVDQLSPLDSYEPDHVYDLTDEQIQQFLSHGYVKLTSCFSREHASEWSGELWPRLEMDPDDKTTWRTERVWLQPTRLDWCKSISPKAWAAMCQLLGGVDRIKENVVWHDGFIVNLGTEAGAGKLENPKDKHGWHVDGDSFMKFLDSPEQALLITPLYSDVASGGGGTVMCPESVGKVARYLAQHPGGTTPSLYTRDRPYNVDYFPPGEALCSAIIHDAASDGFVEMTGNIGDVYIMHPLMVHCHSNNSSRIRPRLITNPATRLRKPFEFDRKDESEYSIVERKTIHDVGQHYLRGWEITAPRVDLLPESVVNSMSAAEQRALRNRGYNIAIIAPDANAEERSTEEWKEMNSRA